MTADDFERQIRREHQEFPRQAIEKLVEMRPGIWRMLCSIRLLPALIRMASRTLAGRWQSARTPPYDGRIVTVHASAPGGGFIEGFYSDGRWWTRDYIEDGTTWGGSTKREIRVIEYRSMEDSSAEPWHDQDNYHPPNFDERPKRADPPPRKPRDPDGMFTHVEKLYDRVLRANRFIRWSPELRPSVAQVQAAIERYFLGLDVEIERVESVPGMRHGFNIHLNHLPRVKHYSCGQDPDTVTPQRQMVLVQVSKDSFHADSMETGGMSSALAMGLNVYMLEELDRLEKAAIEARQRVEQ